MWWFLCAVVVFWGGILLLVVVLCINEQNSDPETMAVVAVFMHPSVVEKVWNKLAQTPGPLSVPSALGFSVAGSVTAGTGTSLAAGTERSSGSYKYGIGGGQI